MVQSAEHRSVHNSIHDHRVVAVKRGLCMVIHAEKIVLAVVIMLSVVARCSHSLGFRSQRLRMKAEESFTSFGIFRQVKRMKATTGTEVEGETVRLISGEEAKIIARGRAGWISVQSLRTNEVRAYFIFHVIFVPITIYCPRIAIAS